MPDEAKFCHPASQTFPYSELPHVDLIVDAAYEGGRAGNAGDDPMGQLLPVGNQGGFRYKGSPRQGETRLAVLYTSGADPDWPDTLDPESGRFTYYGDNKKPGRELHDTARGGNAILRAAFDSVHGNPPRRDLVPPFFVFRWRGAWRDVVFLGLAVPGAREITPRDDLVAVWKTLRGQRFQNYRAAFTILDVPVVSRAWINALLAGNALAESCPSPWRTWVETGAFAPLIAPRIRRWRNRSEQQPDASEGREVIRVIYEYFKGTPTAFEACAARLWQMCSPTPTRYDLTRPNRDGGRDAIGFCNLGPEEDPIALDFALEAKCYAPTRAVDVRHQSRLISRLRPRQFGVLVTTSYVADQAYRELREDAHPVIVIAARDIVRILKDHQVGDAAAARDWLQREFPAVSRTPGADRR